MANLLKPAKEYHIDNCPILEVDSRDSGEHHEDFNLYPQYFLYETFEDTRIDVECPSDNNPVPINITENIKL